MIFARGQWAMPTWIIRAGWVIRVVEVDHKTSILLSKVGMLDCIKHIASATVSLLWSRCISERQQYAAAIAEDPKDRQGELLTTHDELYPAEPSHTNQTIILKLNVQDFRFNVSVDRQDKSKRRIIVIVAQLFESATLLDRNW